MLVGYGQPDQDHHTHNPQNPRTLLRRRGHGGLAGAGQEEGKGTGHGGGGGGEGEGAEQVPSAVEGARHAKRSLLLLLLPPVCRFVR